ncbi:hypothetical protein ACVUCS_003450 [Salmonella enterica subsp. enterica]
MKVQVINNDGTVVWAFDAQERQDSSGTDWNGKKNTEIMAGVVGVLNMAYNQAEIRPVGYKWPFNNHLEDLISTTGGPLAVFRVIARTGVDGARPVHCLCGAHHQNHMHDQ